MADRIRPNKLLLTFLSCLLLLLAHVSEVRASPLATSGFDSSSQPDLVAHHWKRATPVVVTSDTGNTTSVLDPATRQDIPQGAGTDGSGVDFSLPAILWLAFVFVTGAPLALAGIRLWRITTGLGIGLAIAVAAWAAFINTVSADGLSDLILTVIVLGAFAIGFAFGVLDFGRLIGILVLGFLGGFSIGVRVVLFRPGLLIPLYPLNWFVIAVFMVIGLGTVLFKQRLGLLCSCAAIGTFLCGLGVDLVIEKQKGMSFALRFLFDRNNAHFLDITHRGYSPTLLTIIILAASLGAIPILAFAQHKIFKGPFRPKKSTDTEFETASVVDETGANMTESKPPPRVSRMQLLKSRFSMS